MPELLAVRMEMTANDEGAKPKIDCSAIDSKADLDLVETMQMVDAKYDVPGQEMSVYDDVQEIDWAEHIDQSDVNDKVNADHNDSILFRIKMNILDGHKCHYTVGGDNDIR